MVVLRETRLTTRQAAEHLAIQPARVWAFMTRGYSGVQLENARIGQKRFTSKEAIDRFLARINGLPVPLPEGVSQ